MAFLRKVARDGARLLAAASLAGLAISAEPIPVRADALDTLLQERVQLRRNAPRGLEYVPTSTSQGSAGSARTIGITPKIKVNLDGDPVTNVYSNLVPIDFNGNGTFEYLHFNGHRIMRVYGRAGNKVWQISNSGGRALNSSIFIHRDQAAVLDIDGDRMDDVVHCWQSGSTKYLIARKGNNGKEIYKTAMPGQSLTFGAQCRISVYYKQSDKQPIILLSQTQPSGSNVCEGRNYTDNWVQVAAFDKKLNRLWTIKTCDAGHVTSGVDKNYDGLFEYVFVGKYALDFNGKVRCKLENWKWTNGANDHVDGIRIARLNPSDSKIQAIAVGASGGGAYDAESCRKIWNIPIYNPQEMAVAQFDPAPKPLSIMVSNRAGTSSSIVTTVINYKGQKVRTINKRIMASQNIQLDGDRRDDEIVGIFGEVFDQYGNSLLSKGWYWNLKGTKVREKPTSNVYDRWVAYPLFFDMDKDGKEELVTWGQSLIVEGKFR